MSLGGFVMFKAAFAAALAVLVTPLIAPPRSRSRRTRLAAR
jgi:hypothetical protein